MASDQSNLQLEEGPLEDSDNFSLDLSVTTRFYNLQVEETVDQMNFDSVEVTRSLGDRIVFSPGGNEGYLFMETRSNIEEEEKTANILTPREIVERTVLEQEGTVKIAGANNPDEAYNSFTSSVLTWSPRSGGPLTDRASSPSSASVTSYQSTSSTMSMTGRRYLEWDYGSDLGPQYQTQGEAAQSLSQLEKLAIGSYSEYLGEEPVRKEKKERVVAAKQDYLPDSEGDEMRANRFSKFADSLMMQRHLQQQERTRQQRKSVSRETVKANPSTAFGDISIEERGGDRLEIASLKSPVKSSSMSDIPIWPTPTPRIRCVSAHSLAQTSHNMSGPSSSSSTGTVVAVQNRSLLPAMFGDLSIISTSPRSLPPHLQDMVVVTRAEQDTHVQKDKDKESDEVMVMQDVFSTNISDSEEVTRAGNAKKDIDVNVKDKSNQVNVDKNMKADTESEKVETSLSTLEDDIFISDKSSQATPPTRPTVAWTKDDVPTASNFQRFPSEPRSAGEEDILLPIHPRSRQAILSSEQSSVPTTSDEEEVDGQNQAELGLVPNSDYEGDTSTFEYIPGTSFQLQENSSSYEYLPGHLVADNRPPTVLNRRPGSAHTQQSSAGSSVGPARSRDSLVLADIGADLDALSGELREKSEELLAKNISQTKHLFKKLKGYIKFISTPSLTVEDSRVKQELAERIMALLSTEESRLAVGHSSGLTSRALSTNSETTSQGSSSKYGAPRRTDTKALQLPTSNRSKYSSQPASAMSKYSAPSTSTNDLHTPSNTTNTGRIFTESTTRMLERSAESSNCTGEPVKYASDQSSLSSEAKESDNSSKMFDWKKDRTNSELEFQAKKKTKVLERKEVSPKNVEVIQKLQEKRLEHMKKMKKEIKKLEKLDTLIAGAATGKLDSMSDLSLSSSVLSLKSKTNSRSNGVQSEESLQGYKKVKPIKLQRKHAEETPEVVGLQASKNKKKDRQHRPASLHHTDGQQITYPNKHLSRSSSLTTKNDNQHNMSSFGQMFPSPHPSDSETSMRRLSTVTTQTIARVTTRHHSVEIQTDRTVSSEDTFYTSRQKIKPDKISQRKQRRSLPESVAKKKPVAYYLPMDSLSPIRIGRRVLREITGNSENVFHRQENRNILSSYIAALDTQPLVRQPQQLPPVMKTFRPNKMSLQEALLQRRKDFLKHCEARMAALRKAKEARILRSSKQAAWLEEVACQSPRSQRMAEPSFTPVPVVRVFNHRDMVRATRDKYNELPEIQNLKQNTKSSGKHHLNRLMAQIYSSRLQRKAVRGKVSLTHHQMVV